MKIQIKLFRPINSLPNELQISKLDDNETYVLSYSISKFKKNIAIGIVEKFDQKYYIMSIIGLIFFYYKKKSQDEVSGNVLAFCQLVKDIMPSSRPLVDLRVAE